MDMWFQKNWIEVAEAVPKKWPRLTLLDRELIQRKRERLERLLQHRYELSPNEAQRWVDELKGSIEKYDN